MDKKLRALVVALGMLTVGTGLYSYTRPRMTLMADQVVLEAGDTFDPRDYVEEIQFADWEDIVLSYDVAAEIPGTYQVVYQLEEKDYSLQVEVEDTTPPVLVPAKSIPVFIQGDPIEAGDLLESAEDVTPVTLTMERGKEKLSRTGRHSLVIRGEDTSGNASYVKVQVQIDPRDVTPPVISNYENIVLIEHDDLSFLETIKVTDDLDPHPELVFDLRDLDTEKPGTYTILCTAKDKSGNTSQVEAVVDVWTFLDMKAPVISGMKTLTFQAGSGYNLMRGVSVKDDRDPSPSLSVDDSALDPYVSGVYVITYRAEDNAGNVAYANREIHVTPPPTFYTPPGGSVGWEATGDVNQPYLVAVNRIMGTVTVYGKDGEGNYTIPVKAMACSVSADVENTPLGRFKTSSRYEWHKMVDGSYGRYAIRIHGSILFHSVCYYSTNVDDLEFEEYNKLGNPASLGCVRMTVADEMWLYYNCPRGFTTVIYDDTAVSGPLGKPSTPYIDPNDPRRGWDPTDPDPNNPWHQ